MNDFLDLPIVVGGWFAKVWLVFCLTGWRQTASCSNSKTKCPSISCVDSHVDVVTRLSFDMRVVIIPGMGCTPVKSSNWYSWFKKEVDKRERFSECILRNFPDPYACRESRWIPFLENEIGFDNETILVGHSSGASCAMRILEKLGQNEEASKLKGVILVAAAYTDLGDEDERRSEYFNRPWNWDAVKKGAEKIHLFHGGNDHLIPVAEARYIASQLEGDNFVYTEKPRGSHFFQPFQELLDVLDRRF